MKPGDWWNGFGAGVVVVLLFIGAGALVLDSIDKMELRDCYKWRDYEQQYPLYETHPDTAQRCQELGVNVFEYVD